jgi:hypothetical protein
LGKFNNVSTFPSVLEKEKTCRGPLILLKTFGFLVDPCHWWMCALGFILFQLWLAWWVVSQVLSELNVFWWVDRSEL